MTKTILILAAMLALQSEPLLIDLVVAPRSSDEDYETVPISDRAEFVVEQAITSHDIPEASAPFALQLRLDRNAYELGNEFLYEVSLRYIGDTAIAFPVSSEMHLFRKTMPSLRLAAIAISYTSPVLGKQLQVVDTLYGSGSVSGSLISLSPNQTVTVRGKGNWQIRLQKPGATPTWPLVVQPTLDFRFQGGNVNFSSVHLTAVGEIALQKPE